MQPTATSPILSAPASTPRLRYGLIGIVLVASHLATAGYMYQSQPADKFLCPFSSLQYPGLTYDSSLDEWEQACAGSDAASYLHVARNWTDGKGIQALNKTVDPPQYEPFTFWGPGAPIVFGSWLKLTGGQTGLSLLIFATLSQLVFGWITVATAALFTRNNIALGLTALLTGFCPPLRAYFCSIFLSNSEITCLIPVALMYYALARAFLVFRERDIPWKAYGKWFIAAGAAIGVASLSRDSIASFATFIALCCGAWAVWHRTRWHYRRALIAALCVFVSTQVVRAPVAAWNKSRVQHWYVSSSSKTAIWRYGLWMKHDAADWIVTTGLGIGEYLDPEAAERVEQRFANGGSMPQLYSIWSFVKAVAANPGKAFAYKAARLPVLWLGTREYPFMQWTLISIWSAAFYGLLFVYLGASWWLRRRVPEIIYLYALFLLAASPLMHFEFRYSFPVWHGLVMVPGLLWDMFASRRMVRRKQASPALSNRVLTKSRGPVEREHAA